MSKARWIGLGVGLALIFATLGVVVWGANTALTSAGTALAQGAPTPAPSPTGKGGTLIDAFWQALATKLGISVDTLKGKVVEAQKDSIDQALKEGKLTQAQADKMKQHLSDQHPFAPFALGAFRQGFAHGFQHRPGGSLDQLEALAKVLKLSPSELTTQLRSGKTLADVAKAQGVDEATVKQTIIDTAKAQIDRALKDGTITPAQADQLKANLTPDKIDLTHMPGPYNFGRFHR